MIEDPPHELPLEGGDSVETAEVCVLLPPKKLAVLGHKGRNEVFDEVIKAYKEAGREENLRFEEETDRDVMRKVINWVVERKC